MSNPVEILKPTFIRPEDIHLYEETGVDNMKLVERSMTTDAFARIVKAYTVRSNDGNLMGPIYGLSKYIIYNNNKYFWKGFKYLLLPSKINLLKAHKLVNQMKTLQNENASPECYDLYIDNKKLDGFIDFFHKGNCHRDCNECNYFDKFAAKAISYLVPVEEHEKAI